MEEWRPGSFTKNFSWGSSERGLKQLHEIIRLGFDNTLIDTPRSIFLDRIAQSGRPGYIPLNFFLLNSIKHGINFVVVDELVFQAINFRHSSSFDKLALHAFNLSIVGQWKGAKPFQARPALWAKHYVQDRVSLDFDWNTKNVTANDIESFVLNDSRYHAKTARKLATNLSYLYKLGRLSEFRSKKAERWWLSALFLTLDRASGDLLTRGEIPSASRYAEYAIRYGFHSLTGPRSMEKDLATHHFVQLYDACGGATRFSEEATLERQRIKLPQLNHFANNPEPVGVFHSSNPSARNAIPRACAMLAQYLAGFDIIDIDDLDNFDVDRFVKDKVQSTLSDLKNRGIKPTMSAEDLLKLTRGE